MVARSPAPLFFHLDEAAWLLNVAMWANLGVAVGGDDQRQLIVLRLANLQHTTAASLAWQGLVRCGTASTDGASGDDGMKTTWLAADHGG
jgi:hypothetical protein